MTTEKREPPARVGVGIVGAGFLAETRARCYAQTPARLASVVSMHPEHATAYASRHGVARVARTLDELLATGDVDVVDLCVPNHLHRPFAEAAASAGKHVVCTKPLAAYVGQDLGEDASDQDISATPRARMLEVAVRDASAMVDAARKHSVQLMYGENWVHAPSIRRARQLLIASGGVALELRGWESHSGSHSPFSKIWRTNGGGALIRLASHPIGAMLHLKRAEGLARDGHPIRPVAVTAEVADVSRAAARSQREVHVGTGWKDVENWGSCVIAFDDGTRGIAHGSDTLLGGMESKLEVFASNCHFKCNLSPNDLLRSYSPAEGVFGDEYMMEKASTQAGWNTPIPDEDWCSGHLDMCRDFISAVSEGRPAASDGELGLEVTRVVYAAYVSASEGRRVELS